MNLISAYLSVSIIQLNLQSMVFNNQWLRKDRIRDVSSVQYFTLWISALSI